MRISTKQVDSAIVVFTKGKEFDFSSLTSEKFNDAVLSIARYASNDENFYPDALESDLIWMRMQAYSKKKFSLQDAEVQSDTTGTWQTLTTNFSDSVANVFMSHGRAGTPSAPEANESLNFSSACTLALTALTLIIVYMKLLKRRNWKRSIIVAVTTIVVTIISSFFFKTLIWVFITGIIAMLLIEHVIYPRIFQD